MADMCLCRLVVSGPSVEVKRLVRAAAPVKHKASRHRPAADVGPLSFQRLLPVPDGDDPSDVYGTPSREPDDCWRNLVERVGPAQASVQYGFLTQWGEPYPLIRHVSKQYACLDFLLGAVSPAIDETNCWYFRGGRGRNWKMPDRQREAIRRRVWQEAGLDPDDEGDLTVDVEGDHTMMKQVVGRWTAARKRAARRAMGHKR